MKLGITVLMGLPGSGKTTFAQSLRSEFENYHGKHFNFIHVCYDELMPFTNYDEIEEGESNWKAKRSDILNQIDLLLSSVKSDKLESCPKNFSNQLDAKSPHTAIILLIDDNMYLRSMRYALFRKAKQYNAGFCQVYLRSSVVESHKRNISRSLEQVVPLNVITQMNEKIEEPKSTNKWEKYTLVVDSDCDKIKLYTDYFKILNLSLENPESLEIEDDSAGRESDMLICLQNVIHQCDIALRQIISNKIKELRSKNVLSMNLKEYSSELSLKKGKILSEIKSGAIQIPISILTEDGVMNSSDKKDLKVFLEEFLNY